MKLTEAQREVLIYLYKNDGSFIRYRNGWGGFPPTIAGYGNVHMNTVVALLKRELLWSPDVWSLQGIQVFLTDKGRHVAAELTERTQ